MQKQEIKSKLHYINSQLREFISHNSKIKSCNCLKIFIPWQNISFHGYLYLYLYGYCLFVRKSRLLLLKLQIFYFIFYFFSLFIFVLIGKWILEPVIISRLFDVWIKNSFFIQDFDVWIKNLFDKKKKKKKPTDWIFVFLHTVRSTEIEVLGKRERHSPLSFPVFFSHIAQIVQCFVLVSPS